MTRQISFVLVLALAGCWPEVVFGLETEQEEAAAAKAKTAAHLPAVQEQAFEISADGEDGGDGGWKSLEEQPAELLEVTEEEKVAGKEQVAADLSAAQEQAVGAGTEVAAELLAVKDDAKVAAKDQAAADLSAVQEQAVAAGTEAAAAAEPLAVKKDEQVEAKEKAAADLSAVQEKAVEAGTEAPAVLLAVKEDEKVAAKEQVAADLPAVQEQPVETATEAPGELLAVKEDEKVVATMDADGDIALEDGQKKEDSATQLKTMTEEVAKLKAENDMLNDENAKLKKGAMSTKACKAQLETKSGEFKKLVAKIPPLCGKHTFTHRRASLCASIDFPVQPTSENSNEYSDSY